MPLAASLSAGVVAAPNPRRKRQPRREWRTPARCWVRWRPGFSAIPAPTTEPRVHEERDEQIRRHGEAVFGCARFEHDSGGPLNTAPLSADQPTPDQEEGEVRDRQAYGNNEKDETYEHEDGAECEHAGRCSLAVTSWDTTPQENTRNSVAPDSAWEGWWSVVARKSPDSPANSPFAEKAAKRSGCCWNGKGLAERELVGWFVGVACWRWRTRLGHGPQADQRAVARARGLRGRQSPVAASPLRQQAGDQGPDFRSAHDVY